MNKYVTRSTGTASTKNAAITTNKRFKLRVENGNTTVAATAAKSATR
jgi:hypothetical protein